MKKLTRMKLINWHYIVDSTIDFNGSCLVTGDNGAGKSTILDAMQFVLTCGKTRFNSAAHERTKRDLIGYIRCKTGNDTNIYERNGDVTSHICLEFYEEKKKKYFMAGAVMDSSGDLSSPKFLFYRIENRRVTDDLFLNDNKPRNISNFKVKLKSVDGKILNTQSSAQEDFLHRFGGLGTRFTELLPKALAFRPISNVKDFVYSYLLDEKQVNIEFLKENVKTYMEFEKVLKGIKDKIGRLESITESYNELERINENIKVHDYIILRSQKELVESDIKGKEVELKNIETLLSNGRTKELELSDEISSRKNIADELHRGLLNNETYQLINTLEREISDLKSELKRLQNREEEFNKEIRRILEAGKKLMDSGCLLKGMEEFVALSKSLYDRDSAEEFIKIIGTLEQSYMAKRDELFAEKAELEFKRREIEKALSEIEKDIKSLENKQLPYEKNVTNLKDSIREAIMSQMGKDIEPKIVCELLHIKDQVWKDAVEGYLNTQRFNLVVEPEYFDVSIDTYERVKSSKKIHGVGLINTGRIDQYKDCPEDSLAYVVGSNNKYAKYYVNMILGKVVRCGDVSELKKYPTSITPTCMVYQNNTARQINPEVYSKPYIGADAYKKQLELKLNEKKQNIEKLKGLNEGLNRVNALLEQLKGPRFDYIRENALVNVEIRSKEETHQEKKEQLARIDKSTILSRQVELEEIKKTISSLEKQKESVSKENIRYEFSMQNIVKEIKAGELELNNSSGKLKAFEEQNPSILSKAKERFEENLRSRSLENINLNFTRSKTGFETQHNKKAFELVGLQRDYNRDFHFGGAEGEEGIGDFFREYKNLKESMVIEYEEKIKGARERAEEEFKEHFLAKLQENIIQAQNEFKRINDALKGIKFGEDEYKFQYMASKEYEKFYRMIMDDSNLGGFNLFTGAYREKHKEAMDELFERITIDDENSRKALEKFTDYRTFMDYDIKIQHGNGTTSSFSRVCREKSGGETQTPYYVAIAASFVQLYSSSHMEEAVGLILFDEAFDKMDENRIESMMHFLNKLKLQVIIAAPPQKVESISPHVGATMIVFREDKFSFVEALYQNEKLL